MQIYTHNNPIVAIQTTPSSTLVVVPLTLLSVVGLKDVMAMGLEVDIITGRVDGTAVVGVADGTIAVPVTRIADGKLVVKVDTTGLPDGTVVIVATTRIADGTAVGVADGTIAVDRKSVV